MDYKVRLCIAGIVIETRSCFPCVECLVDLENHSFFRAYKRFVYRGSRPSSIIAEVNISPFSIASPKKKPFFACDHFDGSENWRLYKQGNGYLFWSPTSKKQRIALNGSFDRALAEVDISRVTPDFHPFKAVIQEHAGYIWSISDLIYNFFQVLLINYLARRNEGVIAHAAGLDAGKGSGFLFCGKSGAGKSTTAGLWLKNARGAVIINDDRVVVTRRRNDFVIHSSPWVGSFQGYVPSSSCAAPLKKIFLIYHANRNSFRRISGKEAFNYLFPTIFPVLWDKRLLHKTAHFVLEMVNRVPCYRLGLVKKDSVVDFVMNIR